MSVEPLLLLDHVSKSFGHGAAEVKALDNVREHIKTTVAAANLGKELSDSSLDSRLASLKSQAGDVQARAQLAEMKAKKAAQQAAQQAQQGQKTM